MGDTVADSMTALRWMALLLAWLVVAPAHAQLLAVLDKSRPEDAGLSRAKLDALTQAVRGEATRRLPAGFTILSEENTLVILRDMGVDLSRCQGECEVETGRKLGADWVLSQQLTRFGTVWNLQLNLFETATGALRGSERAQVEQEGHLVAVAEEKAGLLCVKVAPSPSAAGMAGRLGEQPAAWDPGNQLGVMVTFESDPPNAALNLDGSYLGQTPLTREVVPGPHRLEWTLARYESLQEAVQVEKRATLKRTLTPLFGWLSVESTPAGQPVQLDGSPADNTPLKDVVVGHGPHVVLVGDSAAAYPQGERFNLGKGERKALSYAIPLREGALLVRCADAQGNAVELPVSVDGTVRGNSPLQLKLPIGEHTIEAGGQRQIVQLKEKQIEPISLTVNPTTAPSAGGHGVAGPLPGMAFVTIPAGTFQMGSPAKEKDRSSDEVRHKVTLSSYAMMTTEVTQAQWQAVMGSNPSSFKGADRPVEKVSWNDVQDFITQLNQKDPGRGYRLPTEAEWEYACRAGSTGRWCFGENEGQLDEYAWYSANSSSTTHPVGQMKSNAWGLFDMHGNVWELCQDSYGVYGRRAQRDPWGPNDSFIRVRRGGGWSDCAQFLRCAFRFNYDATYSSGFLGFRLVRTP
jgi:formylglycine-generating enzyme required for sulfatase activity